MQHIASLLERPERAIGLIMLACAGILVMALGLEHLGGYLPCELCYKERYAYYASIPLGILAYAAISMGRPTMAQLLIGIAGLALLANAGLGLYHAGVEWHWWQGPSECTGNADLTTDVNDLLKNLGKKRIVRCDQPALQILGLSLAAWNVPICLALACLAGVAVRGLGRGGRYRA